MAGPDWKWLALGALGLFAMSSSSSASQTVRSSRALQRRPLPAPHPTVQQREDLVRTLSMQLHELGYDVPISDTQTPELIAASIAFVRDHRAELDALAADMGTESEWMLFLLADEVYRHHFGLAPGARQPHGTFPAVARGTAGAVRP